MKLHEDNFSYDRYFAFFSLPPSATLSEVKARYKELARAWYPPFLTLILHGFSLKGWNEFLKVSSG